MHEDPLPPFLVPLPSPRGDGEETLPRFPSTISSIAAPVTLPWAESWSTARALAFLAAPLALLRAPPP